MSSPRTVICYAKRTPIGKLLGGLSSIPAPKLGAVLVEDAVKSLNIDINSVDEAIIGQVLTSGAGQAPARQTVRYGGLSDSTVATTIGRVCGSGMKSVMLADQAIRLGDAKTVVAGGQENMSLAPHLLPSGRTGIKFGNGNIVDSMQYDGLWDPYDNVPMGNCGEVCAKEFKFSREEQDSYTIRSYERARKAWEDGTFEKEVVPVKTTIRRKEVMIEKDEEPFSVDLDKIPTLRPAFDKAGTITAGNASSINDGAAVAVLCDEETAKKNGWTIKATIIAQASHAQAPTWFTTAPIGCIQKLLQKSGLTVNDIDAWEINEAFAVVAMAAMKEFELSHEKVNINGGAVSIGHPIGCSGTRILATLINAMEQKDLKRGLATLCIGGGEASGIIIERP